MAIKFGAGSFTMTYDDGRGASHRLRVAEPDRRAVTVAFWSGVVPDPPRRLIYIPSVQISHREHVAVVFEELCRDASAVWDEFWALFALHPWSQPTWKQIAFDRLKSNGLGNHDAGQVAQSAQADLWCWLQSQEDWRAWIEDGRGDLHGWLGDVMRFLCQLTIRDLWRQQFGSRTHRRLPLTDDALKSMADYRGSPSTELPEDVVRKLDEFPERTRLVASLIAADYTWREIVATLKITLGEARWAFDSQLDALRREFRALYLDSR